MLTTHPSEVGEEGLAKLQWYLRNAPFFVITQRVVAIYYRRFGTTYRSHSLSSRIIHQHHSLSYMGKTVFLDRPQEAKLLWEICDGLSLHTNSEISEGILPDLSFVMPIPVATWFKAWVCGPPLDGIVGSNPTGCMDVYLFVSVLCYQEKVFA